MTTLFQIFIELEDFHIVLLAVILGRMVWLYRMNPQAEQLETGLCSCHKGQRPDKAIKDWLGVERVVQAPSPNEYQRSYCLVIQRCTDLGQVFTKVCELRNAKVEYPGLGTLLAQGLLVADELPTRLAAELEVALALVPSWFLWIKSPSGHIPPEYQLECNEQMPRDRVPDQYDL